MSLLTNKIKTSVFSCISSYRKTLPGINSDDNFRVFLRQVYDSIQRVEYYFVIRENGASYGSTRLNPDSTHFDPIRAASRLSLDDLDEAAWLLYLATHFGPNKTTGWKLVGEVYGGLGSGHLWSWSRTTSGISEFSLWIEQNIANFSGKFGNHRKYMSLRPSAKTGNTLKSIHEYIKWVQSYGSHAGLVDSFQTRLKGNQDLFDALYRSMYGQVFGFGRTGCFDFLCALGKMEFFPVEPSSLYLTGATGPQKGAQLILGEYDTNTKDLESKLMPLAGELSGLGVRFVMQVLEDALCNWQKSPATYRRFSR